MKQTLRERLIRRFLIACVRRVVRRRHPTVVVVTGSLGKTSTRAAIAHAIDRTWPVYTRSLKSNFDRGPLMAFFGLRPNKSIHGWQFWLVDLRQIFIDSWRYPHSHVVLEMSEISLDDQQDLLQVMRPDISVITALATVHAAGYEENNVVGQIQRLISLSHTVVYNADFAALNELVKNHPRSFSYGVKASADFMLVAKQHGQKTALEVRHGTNRWRVKSRQIGRHSGVAYTAALAVTNILGGDMVSAVRGLMLLKPVRGRLNPLRGIRGSLVIDDCYNANAISVGAALDTLASFESPRVAVLGSMNELGEYSARDHKSVGVKVARCSDLLICIGEDSIRYLATSAEKSGMSRASIHCFVSARDAGEFLENNLPKNATVLGKGSQDKVYAEDALLPIVVQRDRKKLVRQTAFWRHKKNLYYESISSED